MSQQCCTAALSVVIFSVLMEWSEHISIVRIRVSGIPHYLVVQAWWIDDAIS